MPTTTTRGSSATIPVAVAVGVAGGLISLLRLWLGNAQALTEVLWAEDGLFPLCIHKADFLTCTTQPFAGYLLFTPRVLAWPVSVLPLEQWALATNVAAALLAGGAAFLAYVFARRFGLSTFTSLVIALLPVMAPMSGLEAINAVGSSYMLLLYVSTLALVFGQPSRGWWVVAVVLIVITALTIPSAVVLVPVVLVQWARGRITRGWSLGLLAALVVGLAAQAWAAVNAVTPRPISIGAETLNSWADSVPISLLTYWPGLSIGEFDFFTNFTLTPVAWTGWLVVGVLAIMGVVFVVRGWGGDDRRLAIGMLLLAGLAFGLIPSAIGFANNRYFVVPVVLWGAAGLIALDPVIRRTRWWIAALVSALVLIVWWPAIPASWFRSTPAPPWTQEVERVKAFCIQDPAITERPQFTPYWPPNWGDGLDEPTHPNIACTTVFRWID